MLGRVVGSYRIVEKIGEGGMGAVYLAVDEMLEREVAIKAIRPDLAREPQIVERFRAEAKILARVSHPAIAGIYSFFYDGGELFLAMELVRGRTLSDVIEGPPGRTGCGPRTRSRGSGSPPSRGPASRSRPCPCSPSCPRRRPSRHHSGVRRQRGHGKRSVHECPVSTDKLHII